MTIERIHSFLVHPAKNVEEQPAISGAQIPLRGSLYNMLNGVFSKAPQECDVDIVFRPDNEGQQNNVCRNLVVAYAQRPLIENGRKLAKRLQSVSTNRSGLGLLFLIKGTVDDKHQLVISRFPADQGVVAQEHAQRLSVEFIERVFMKNTRAYKSALYSSDSFERGFWDGHAVDHQISGARELSDYWIRDFLTSELRTTGPAGTKRLAVALRSAIQSAGELGIRQELISAVSLLRNKHGQRQSVRQLVEQLGLSPEAANALKSAFSRSELMDEVFQFDRDEFQRHAPYRSVELDNGGILIAEDALFAEVFRQEVVNEADNYTRFITEGCVIDERLRKRK